MFRILYTRRCEPDELSPEVYNNKFIIYLLYITYAPYTRQYEPDGLSPKYIKLKKMPQKIEATLFLIPPSFRMKKLRMRSSFSRNL